MRLSSWFDRPSRRPHEPRRTSTLQVEALEERSLPSASVADPGQGYTLTILGGNGQAAPIGTSFDNRLQVLVEYNGQPVPHALVDFTAPSSGPSGYFGPIYVMFPLPGHVDYPTSLAVSADENGVATAPTFVANGATGPFNVTAEVLGPGTRVTFTLAEGTFPGPLPPSVSHQLLVDLAARPSFTDPRAHSELTDRFGTLFAVSYLQSPQEASQLFWQEVNLTRDLILAGGDFRRFQSNLGEWKLSYETSINPLYTTPLGYGMALLECEAILSSAQ